MYQYLDQPVGSLCAGSRLLLWAARGWAHARASGTCPPGAIAPAFLHCGAIGVLPDVARLLLLLEGGDDERLALPPLGSAHIDDVEAVLVQLWSDALVRPRRARATLTMMLAEGEDAAADSVAVDAAFAALGRVATGLLGKGLAPEGLAEPNRART